MNVGSDPTVMAETSDGNFLWIGLSGAGSVAQFDLINQQLTATISLASMKNYYQVGTAVATGLAAMPGSDTTLAVNDGGVVGIFDTSGNNGTFRPNFAGDDFATFPDASHLYTYDNLSTGAEFYRYSINASGATLIDGTTLDLSLIHI